MGLAPLCGHNGGVGGLHGLLYSLHYLTAYYGYMEQEVKHSCLFMPALPFAVVKVKGHSATKLAE